MDTGLSKVSYSLHITQCYMKSAPPLVGEPLTYVQRIWKHILKGHVESSSDYMIFELPVSFMDGMGKRVLQVLL